MTTITVNTPAKVSAPRGAKVAADLFSALLTWFETKAEQRVERREQSGRQAEAARVRLYAQEMLAQDPRFAADLFAAADRHERS